MTIWGVNNFNHDSSISVFKDNVHLFSSHSERYSRIKNEYSLCDNIMQRALTFGKPDLVLVSENNIKKKLRQLITLDERFLDSHKSFFSKYEINNYKYLDHHECHAAGAAFTSTFSKSLVFVFDSVGEFTTTSTWLFQNSKLTLLHKLNYPNSLGLFYTAFTDLLGLKPNEEEYILMGMAAFGEPTYFNELYELFDIDLPDIKLKKNLHKGIKFKYSNKFNLAKSVQVIFEYLTNAYVSYFKKKYNIENACFSGGCALNCKANSNYLDLFKNVWVYPNSGDAGNSLGAVLNYTKCNFPYSPYLGETVCTNIEPEAVVDEILKNKIAGIINGRAEYGPRALGNRSILADPRDNNIKSVLNKLKNREDFRPFAPVILRHEFSNYFKTSVFDSKYMTLVFKAKTDIKSIQNIDGTSRVQTINKQDNKLLYDIVSMFQCKTGIPFLINTSLNVKGHPIVNTKTDNNFDFKVF